MGQLTKTDRQEIAYYLSRGHKKSNIGDLMGRSKSVVTEEIRRNSVKGVYDAKKADAKSYQRRYWVEKEPQKIRSQPELVTYIEEKLQQLNPWSPETIAGCWNQERAVDGFTISAPTIYNYLYKHRPSLCKYLCQKRYKKKKHKKKTKREMIPNRVPITERPEIVEKRARLGDWEGDTIVSIKGDKTAILVLHDRASRYIRVSKTKDITKKRMIPKVRKLLKNLPQHTLTLDNGIEFKGHQSFGINTFFCRPYASWEKGAVEYSNRLIRRHFPKKTRLGNIHQKKLASVIKAINNTPRKCLNWKTPQQVFSLYSLF
jgi:IS30 family transposase